MPSSSLASLGLLWLGYSPSVFQETLHNQMRHQRARTVTVTDVITPTPTTELYIASSTDSSPMRKRAVCGSGRCYYHRRVSHSTSRRFVRFSVKGTPVFMTRRYPRGIHLLTTSSVIFSVESPTIKPCTIAPACLWRQICSPIVFVSSIERMDGRVPGRPSRNTYTDVERPELPGSISQSAVSGLVARFPF